MNAEQDLRTQVAAALLANGISQAEAARRLGLSNKHLNQMITGRAVLTIPWAERILALTGMRLVISLAHDATRAVPAPVAQQPAAEDICRPVEIDGEIIRVRGAAEMSDESRAALAEAIAAAKRRYLAEHPEDEQQPAAADTEGEARRG
ncbi:helix-turn-helix domain-containing protein [Streptomyces sp. NPDC002519]